MRAMLALLVMTSVASAGGHEIAVGSAIRTLRSDSANALTADSLGGGTLAYAHALDLDVAPGLALWATGTYGWGAASGTMFQTLTTQLDTLSFTVGGRARYALRRWLVASAQLDVGTARAAVSIADTMGHSAGDHGWGATAQVAAAMDVLVINAPRFRLGMRVDLGYVAASGIGLTATPSSGSSGMLHLAMNAASLGSLDLSGAVFGVSVVSQF